jgi:putative sigma-54 modulation protein
MKISVFGKNVEVTQPMKQHASEKLSRLELDEKAEIQVTFSLVGHQHLHKTEITLRSGGTTIRAEEATTDMYASIDQAAYKLTGKLRKWKEKMRTRLKRVGPAVLATDPHQGDNEDEDEVFQVERIKTVDLKPANLQEAILQMHLLDHAFHVFINEESNQTEVVYKRYDGTYGLIRNSI